MTMQTAAADYERMGRDDAADWLRRHGWLQHNPCELWDEKTTVQRTLATAYRRGYFGVEVA